MTDASDTAVGAVLQQYINNHWHPISYFSKALKPAETCYSTFDRELLAVYLAVKQFRYFVEGRSFHVLTDHKPPIFALQTRSEKHSPRQARHLDYVTQFTSDIRHIKGTSNSPADALSRIEANAISTNPSLGLDLQAMASAQDSDPDITRLRSSQTSLTLESVPLPMSESTILCDTSTGVARPVVPLEFRHAVFNLLHSLSLCSHVFIRHDVVRTPLKTPYDGPYKVLDRSPKYFTVDIKGRRRTISLDRLKPAFIDSSTVNNEHTPESSRSTVDPPQCSPPTTNLPEPVSTRSGRRVHWPKALADYVP